MQRRSDWLARLNAYIAAAHGRAFEYGKHDCALFAGGAIEAMTGEDLAAPFRGAYSTLGHGMKAVMRAGYNGPFDLLRAHLAAIPIAQAQVGDLAMLKTPAGPAIGVVQGARIFYVTDRGLLTVGLLDASIAFKVP